MVGTARSIEITKVRQFKCRVVLMYSYATRGLGFLVRMLCSNLQEARPRQTMERRLTPLYDKS